jgi:hypothetical protein
MGLLDFNIMRRRPTLRTQLIYCCTALVSALWGVAFGHRDIQTLTPRCFFPSGFLDERLYSNGPRSLELLKYGIEQTIANTDPETLRKFPRYILERLMLVLEIVLLY